MTPFKDYEVLVLAPLVQDASIAVEVLGKSNVYASAYGSLDDLCRRLESSAGAVLIAEEALTEGNSESLECLLEKQEAWSNLPFILMTSKTENIFSTEKIMSIFASRGSFSIIERPFKIITLTSSVNVALSTREKQYQVRDLIQQQQLAVQQRDDFLSIASHELKTPMTSLQVLVQMRKRQLKRGDESASSPERVISLIDATDTQLHRLSRLVDDMLDISRIVNGKLTLNVERIDLEHLISSVLENFRSEFELAGSRVEYRTDSKIALKGDPYRLEQVLANLFTNAIKYGSGKAVTVLSSQANGVATIQVRDQGMGIALENQKRIFDRFERAVAGSAISGLGLGLYISKQIVEMHKGRIYVESHLGEGANFIIELPVEE